MTLSSVKHRCFPNLSSNILCFLKTAFVYIFIQLFSNYSSSQLFKDIITKSGELVPGFLQFCFSPVRTRVHANYENITDEKAMCTTVVYVKPSNVHVWWDEKIMKTLQRLVHGEG